MNQMYFDELFSAYPGINLFCREILRIAFDKSNSKGRVGAKNTTSRFIWFISGEEFHNLLTISEPNVLRCTSMCVTALICPVDFRAGLGAAWRGLDEGENYTDVHKVHRMLTLEAEMQNWSRPTGAELAENFEALRRMRVIAWLAAALAGAGLCAAAALGLAAILH